MQMVSAGHIPIILRINSFRLKHYIEQPIRYDELTCN